MRGEILLKVAMCDVSKHGMEEEVEDGERCRVESFRETWRERREAMGR